MSNKNRIENLAGHPPYARIDSILIADVKGGTTASLLEDFVQANLIVRLITGVDSLIRNSNNKVKHNVRQNRERLIATLPPRRVWLSIKRLRHIIYTDTESETMSFDYHEGKEDAIANGKRDTHLYPPHVADRNSELCIPKEHPIPNHLSSLRRGFLLDQSSQLRPSEHIDS